MKLLNKEYDKIFVSRGNAWVVKSVDLPSIDTFKIFVGVHPTLYTEHYQQALKKELTYRGVILTNIETLKDTIWKRDDQPTYSIGVKEKGNLISYFIYEMKEHELFDIPSNFEVYVGVHCDEYHSHTKPSCLTANIKEKERDCGKCDCVEQEMKRLGVDGVKSYPCLKASDNDDLVQEKKQHSEATGFQAHLVDTASLFKKTTAIGHVKRPVIMGDNQGLEPLPLSSVKFYNDTDMGNFARKIAIEFANWYGGSMDAELSFDNWALRRPDLFNDKKHEKRI
jgi:hypothetical protein